MKRKRPTRVQQPLSEKLKTYAKLSKSMALVPLKKQQSMLPLGAAFLAALPIADAQIVYSGTQNVACALAGNTNRCYANINNAGGNDFEIHRNHAFGDQFIQIDEVGGGGFSLQGFIGNQAGDYCYPTPLASGFNIGAAGPWANGAGQGNTLSEINNAYPGDQWIALPGGTTRFVGIRGNVAGTLKYGWIRLTKNGFGNYTIVDWAYNSTTNASILAGQTVPIELIDFDYEVVQADIKLKWVTATEVNNAGFDIERSEDGVNFRSIGWVDGSGTSSKESTYEFIDKGLQNDKVYYYRLRQVDVDGTATHSGVVSAKLGSGGTVVSELYPNPTKSGRLVSLNFSARKEGEWKVEVFDASGKAINIPAKLDFQVTKGLNYLSFDVSSLSPGIYFLKMDNSAERIYRKLVID